MSMIRSVLVGAGSYLPKRIMTNDDISKIVDTTDEWITARTGIKQRHIAADGELTSDLAVNAANAALADAGLKGSDIDLIVLATATPDQTFPATAVRVQHAIGMTGGAAFDIQAVCSGFIYAVATADNFIKAGQAKRVLVIGAETFSRILDWEDRGTCVLFGDGAGAMIFEGQPGHGSREDRGVLTSHLHSDGKHNNLLYVDGGPSSTQTVGHLRMNGKEVFRHAVVNIAQAIQDAIDELGLDANDINWFVPHQANQRILDGTAKRLGISSECIVSTVALHGNTSAASVPLAYDVARKDGRIKNGQLVLLEAMGGGFTWGSALIRV